MTNNNDKIDSVIEQFKLGNRVFEYIQGVQPVDYSQKTEMLEQRFKEACRSRSQLLIRVDYPFVRADQIAVKLICELYETLDANRFLCSQLPKSYKVRYVVLYKSITQDITVNEIIRHAERNEIETGGETSLSNSGGMNVGVDLKGLIAEINRRSTDAVVSSLKKRTVIEDVTEKNQQVKPAPLDPDNATRALQKLIDDLAQEELILYSEYFEEQWNNLPRRFESKSNLQSLAAKLTKPLRTIVNFLTWITRLVYEVLQVIVGIVTFWSPTLGKRHVHVLLTLQVSSKDLQTTDFKNQLNALVTNPHISCLVFETL